MLVYRSDVKEFGSENNKQVIMTEEQFVILEQFCSKELKLIERGQSFEDDIVDFISTKKFIESFREKCNITKEIHTMLFGDEDQQAIAMNTINFYNEVKKVIIRSGGADKYINLKILTGLIKELRIKLDIIKSGLGADKTMREINFGFSEHN